MEQQQPLSQNELKRAAARYALERYIQSGMLVGLGSGSTSELFVEELGRAVGAGTLTKIVGVATSEKVEALARTFGISVAKLADVPGLDVTVDGADEIEPKSFALTKGRGGALLREKLVAIASKLEVIIADESKLVTSLGQKMPIPVEVIPFGYPHTVAGLRQLGLEPILRINKNDGSPYLTDSNNYIFDCRTPPITDPAGLDSAINNIVGVVEHGIFTGIAGRVIIAAQSGVYEVTR